MTDEDRTVQLSPQAYDWAREIADHAQTTVTAALHMALHREILGLRKAHQTYADVAARAKESGQ